MSVSIRVHQQTSTNCSCQNCNLTLVTAYQALCVACDIAFILMTLQLRYLETTYLATLYYDNLYVNYAEV